MSWESVGSVWECREKTKLFIKYILCGGYGGFRFSAFTHYTPNKTQNENKIKLKL